MALSLGSRDPDSEVLEVLLSSSRLVVPWYWTPFTIETLAALLRVFVLPTLLRGRAFYNSLTFLLFDDVAPKYQYRDSKSEVEKRYRQENFGEHFQAREGAYAATKNIAGEARSE